MANYGEERTEYYKSQIRRLRAIEKKITCQSVADALNIDKDYANKLINEILIEGRQALDKEKVVEEIEATRARLEALNRELLDRIMVQPKIDAQGNITNAHELLSDRDRNSAIKTIRENENMIFELLFKAGLFERAPEKLLLEHEMKTTSTLAEVLNLILKEVDNDTGYRITGIISDYIKSSRGSTTSTVEEQSTTVQ